MQAFPAPVDVEKVQAKYEDGMLRLVIPKLEKDITRKQVQIE
jgi:HSP20 family molecular chaperone IbpA